MEIEINNFTKQEIRKNISNKVSCFVKNCDYKSASIKAQKNFLQSSIFIEADVILCYIPLKNEIDTSLIISQSLSCNKIVCIPKVLDKDSSLERKINFYILQNNDIALQTSVGSYGILEPVETLEIFDVKKFVSNGVAKNTEKDTDKKLENNIKKKIVCITPLVAVDKKGNRLGKGKGYYDNFFSDKNFRDDNFFDKSFINKDFITKVGFAYACQVVEQIPEESHDIKMDYVITEEGVVRV